MGVVVIVVFESMLFPSCYLIVGHFVAALLYLQQEVTDRMLSGTTQVTTGFTVRTVYCCNVCGLEVNDYQKIIGHLAVKHMDTETVKHSAMPQQEDKKCLSLSTAPPSRHNSTDVWNKRSAVSEAIDYGPLVCAACRRVFKYRRCFERHVKKHKTATRLISPKIVNDLERVAEISASQIPSDSLSLSGSEPSQGNSIGSSANDPLNDDATETVSHSATPLLQVNSMSSSTLLPSKRQSSSVWNMRSDYPAPSETVKPLVCPVCSRVYKYRRCLERHIKKHRTAMQLTSPEIVDDLECVVEEVTTSNLASDTFNSSDSEQRQDGNNFTHNPLNDVDRLELPEVSEIMDGVLTTESADIQRDDEADSASEALYCCPECPGRFPNLNSFRLHTVDKHSGWTFVCKWCGQLFTEGRELRSHVVNDHSINPDDGGDEELAERVFNSRRCTLCGRSYRSSRELAVHTTSHDDVRPGFTCSMCSGRFRASSGLKSHLQRVHSGDHPYFCELCGDRFVAPDERDNHVRQHAADLCSSCGVRLCRRPYGGGSSESGPAACNVCYLERLSSRDGVQIIGKTTAGNPVPERSDAAITSLPLKYSCRRCGVKFTWLGSLRRHERRHAALDLQPESAAHFQCSYCGRVFRQAGGLHRHILRHVKPGALPSRSLCTCTLCGQRFCWKKSLARHLTTAHPPPAASHRIPVLNHTLSDSSSSKTDGVEWVGSQERGHCRDSFEANDHLGQRGGTTNSPAAGGVFDGVSRDGSRRDQGRPEVTEPVDPTNSSTADPVPPPDKTGRRLLVPCPDCGAEFFWRSNMTRHVREHHRAPARIAAREPCYSERRLQCKRCGRRFSRLAYLRAHLHAHQQVDRCGGGGGAAAETERRRDRLLCSQCGCKTSSARGLAIHAQRHAGVRPHQCR